MATQDPRTIVRIGTRLWSDEVAIATAGDVEQAFDKAYEFGNKREFVTKQNYFPANTEPADNPPDA